jgi:hypothetical protein
VQRGLFEPDELRGLTITDREKAKVVAATDDMPRGERHMELILRGLRKGARRDASIGSLFLRPPTPALKFRLI